MPKFGQLIDTDILEAATRTLTDFSAEEIFDLPAMDASVPSALATITSSATINTFGSWVQLVADVGIGKRLISLVPHMPDADSRVVEVEVGEGAGGSEVAIGRFLLGKPSRDERPSYWLWLALSDNARLSIRIRDDQAAAKTYYMSRNIA